MGKTNRDIGNLFADGGEGVSQNGTFSSRRQNDIVFAYSYSTPIAAIQGNVVLVTVDCYSMTTSSKHMPQVRSARGEHLPTDERILRDLAAGYCTFENAIAFGVQMRERAMERNRKIGVYVQKEWDRYVIPRTPYAIVKVGKRWQIVQEDPDTTGSVVISDHRSFRGAKVAAWDLVDHEPSGHADWRDAKAVRQVGHEDGLKV